MLQIISGKFYKTNDCHENEGKGITFSNFTCIQPIKTKVATLEPVDFSGNKKAFVITYINKIEKPQGPTHFAFVKVGDATIVDQFQLLCTFGLRAFFNVNRETVELNCREEPKSSTDTYVPSRFVDRFFDTKVEAKEQEIQQFITFVDKVIGLPRDKYLAVINCLVNFSNALQVLNYNLDLAYSMLVYCIESLSQKFDEYEPVWTDHPKHRELDRFLSSLPLENSSEIKKVLLNDSHLRLQSRFKDFAQTNLDDRYFVEGSYGVKNSLKKSELKKVLENAYDMRSKYVHALQPIREQLKVPEFAHGDVLHWGNKPYLSFRGLSRLTHRIITNFILSQESFETEDYNWAADIPGMVRLYLAPQYWLPTHQGFQQEEATKRLSGFLQIFETILFTAPEVAPVNLTDLMGVYEQTIPNARRPYKTQMLTLYYLYNMLLNETFRMPNFDRFIERQSASLNQCTVETMLLKIFSEETWPWNVEDCVRTFQDYSSRRFSESALVIPRSMELALILELANTFLRKGDEGNFKFWVNYGVLEAAGHKEIQDFLANYESKYKIIDLGFVLTGKKVEAAE